MALKIRHKERFNRSNADGGAGSPQSWDADHEIEGSYKVDDIEGLPEALSDKASASAIETRAPKEAPVFTGRIDLSATSLTASWRPDSSGNLGWYVGAAGASDGAQLKVATVDKTTGSLTFGRDISVGSKGGAREIAIGMVNTLARLRERNYMDQFSITTNMSYANVQDDPTKSAWQMILGYGAGQDCFDLARADPGGGFVSFLRASANGNVNIGASSFSVALQRVNIAGGLKIEAANPGNHWWATSGGTNEKGWDIFVDAGAKSWSLRTLNDTFAASAAVLTATRSGMTVTKVSVGADFGPINDNSKTNGGPSNRWSVVYAGTGSISTSDATLKAMRDGTLIGLNFKVSLLEDAEIAAARALVSEIGVYKWQDAIAEKGDGARLHIGLTVQRAIEIMEAHGLDPWRYAFICRDEITRKVMRPQTVLEQKTAPDPEFDIVVEVIEDVPTQVRKARPPRPVFEMKPLIGLDGEIVTRTVTVEAESGFPVERQELVLHPVPVMIEVEREVEVEEPAGERLGFRYDQLTLFMLRGMLARIEALETP